ncbi:MAG: ORF6N domain-containing protein [Minisyncoccia bacterium]|jgi:hypothetical protein
MPLPPAGIPAEIVERRILLIRGRKVMLDRDLAELYGVPTFRLNEAVKRNTRRFPEDFMFQLVEGEVKSLTSQFAMSKPGRGGRRTLPYVFTEQGIAMLSSVLNSERAIAVNILIMRVFVKLRELMASHQELARRVEELERKYRAHGETINDIFRAIKDLLAPPEDKKGEKPMGFLPE